MKSISIYTITRNQNIECLQKLERQLSGRTYFLKMREWELESMKALVRELEVHMQDVHALRFFYSFQVPRLGKEFDLLQLFVTNRGKVFSRESLLETIWKYDYLGDLRTVDVHIRRLREKIERVPSQPEYIFTKWGVGYYFTDKD